MSQMVGPEIRKSSMDGGSGKIKNTKIGSDGRTQQILQEGGPQTSRSRLSIIMFTIFIDLIGFGIILPLMPFYAEQLGGSPIVFGLLIASFTLMQFIFAPILGRISDRVGRRPVIIATLGGASVAHLIFAFADSLPLLFISRILAGIAAANLSVAQAYIADSTYPKERTKWMAKVGAAFGVGFIVGPIIGGSLISYGFWAPGLVASATDEGFTLLEGIKSQEARNLIKVFDNFPSELAKVQGDDFFLKLSDRVKALQDDFQIARAGYMDFKHKLMEDVIKPLETTHRIPNGGKCHICRLLRSKSQ